MTYLNIHSARHRGPGIFRLLARVTERARERRRIRREMIALSDLPDHLLRDMGLHDRLGWREKGVRDAAGWGKDPMWRHRF